MELLLEITVYANVCLGWFISDRSCHWERWWYSLGWPIRECTQVLYFSCGFWWRQHSLPVLHCVSRWCGHQWPPSVLGWGVQPWKVGWSSVLLITMMGQQLSYAPRDSDGKDFVAAGWHLCNHINVSETIPVDLSIWVDPQSVKFMFQITLFQKLKLQAITKGERAVPKTEIGSQNFGGLVART